MRNIEYGRGSYTILLILSVLPLTTQLLPIHLSFSLFFSDTDNLISLLALSPCHLSLLSIFHLNHLSLLSTLLCTTSLFKCPSIKLLLLSLFFLPSHSSSPSSSLLLFSFLFLSLTIQDLCGHPPFRLKIEEAYSSQFPSLHHTHSPSKQKIVNEVTGK